MELHEKLAAIAAKCDPSNAAQKLLAEAMTAIADHVNPGPATTTGADTTTTGADTTTTGAADGN